jgi:hypothetical protein
MQPPFALSRFARAAFHGLLVLTWIALVGIGMKVLLDYQVQPGTAAQAPATWPAASAIPYHAGSPALVLMAHPRCPCTRATLAELERLVADTRGALDVTVLFVIPAGFDRAWAHADLWRRAAAIPGVRLVEDPEGREAGRFGAFTSGQALLYDGTGRLAFAGGITPGRGHEGDNAGRDAIVACVRPAGLTAAQPAAHRPQETPVYGCALATSEDARQGGRRCPK